MFMWLFGFKGFVFAVRSLGYRKLSVLALPSVCFDTIRLTHMKVTKHSPTHFYKVYFHGECGRFPRVKIIVLWSAQTMLCDSSYTPQGMKVGGKLVI